MTLLRREALVEALARPLDTRLVVTPLLSPSQVGAASIDLRLGSEFLLLQRTAEPGLDPRHHSSSVMDDMHERVIVPLGQGFWLHPRHFVLAATLEYLRLPNDLGGYVLGRSSWGRVGLIVATAIMVHPGFTGALTLELVNEGDSPICLYPGTRIAQLAIHSLGAATDLPYGSGAKYRTPIGPQASRLAREAPEIEKLESVAGRLSSYALPFQDDSVPEVGGAW